MCFAAALINACWALYSGSSTPEQAYRMVSCLGAGDRLPHDMCVAEMSQITQNVQVPARYIHGALQELGTLFGSPC